MSRGVLSPQLYPQNHLSASYSQTKKAVSHNKEHVGGHELFQPTKHGVWAKLGCPGSIKCCILDAMLR